MDPIKRRAFIRNLGIGTTGVLLLQNTSLALADSRTDNFPDGKTLHPQDNGKALVNPDMGWVLYFYSNILTNYGSKLAPSDTVDEFPGISTVFMRVPWSFIESEEGKFNWELLDTPAQRWINKGKKAAFLVSASESWMRYATPEWVKQAGAKGYDWGDNKAYWEPDFGDPIFLQKAENFVAEMGRRYDGNEEVAYVGIGHFGLWGEGHTVISSHIDYPLEVKKKHLDMYSRHFKKTRLYINDDFAGPDKPGKRFPITDYAFSQGISLFDSSILVQPPPHSWYHAEMAQLFWPSMPVVLEHEHYGGSVQRKAWSKDLLLEAIEDYHASYMSIHWWPHEFLEANRDIIDKINLRMGYRIQLRSLNWPGSVTLGKPFKVFSSWANAGVAPCYPGGFPCITLKDEAGGIVSVQVDESLNVRDLPVGAPGKAAPVALESACNVAPAFHDPVAVFSRQANPGKYDLYVSVGRRDGTPVLALPYEGDDGHRRYKMGSIQVLERNG